MHTHILKTDPKVFGESWQGNKSYEVRKDDRNYQIDDILILKETTSDGELLAMGSPLAYTGRQLTRRIISKTTKYGMQPGWCVLGVVPI